MLKTFKVKTTRVIVASIKSSLDPRSFFTRKSSIFQWRWSSHWSTVRPLRVDSSYFRAQTRRLSHRSDGKRRQTTRSRNIVTDGCNPVRLDDSCIPRVNQVRPRIFNPWWFWSLLGNIFWLYMIDIVLLDHHCHHPIFHVWNYIEVLAIWNNYEGSEN